MPLPSDFQFSQASLQDFVDCPRRFLLRYVLDVVWPAAESEPIEKHERRMRLGQAFHRMVQQQLLGIPEERLRRMATDPDLERWWRNYRAYRPAHLPGVRRPEVALTAPLAGYRLVAKYDLIVVAPGAEPPQRPFTIFDWKTSQFRTAPAKFETRLQTRVYRYLAVRAGAHLAGASVEPAQVAMVYWFAEHPESPARLLYSPALYREDEAYLTGLVERIAAMPEAAFALTPDEQRCRYCAYRSYCDRGTQAGDLHAAEAEDVSEPDSASDLDFDFEQIAEIAF